MSSSMKHRIQQRTVRAALAAGAWFLVTGIAGPPRLARAAAPAPASTAPGPQRMHYEVRVETAAAEPQPLERTAASVTVFTEDDIRASGLTLVADLLRRAAGVDVSRQGSAGKATLARIDGAASTQTLVLVDGVEINSPTLDVADLADLTLDNVERIEIVRGPMSALHGSSAMGGVIQIFTRRGQGAPSGLAELSAGSFGTYRGAARVGGGSTALGWSLGASRTRADGRRFDTAAGPLEHDAYRNTTLSGGLTSKLGEHTTLSLDGRLADAERDLPIEVFGAQAFDVNSTQADRSGLAALRLNGRLGRNGAIEPTLRLGFAAQKQDFDDPRDPGEDGPFASDFSATVRGQRLEAALDAAFALGARDRLVLGTAIERRAGENEDSFSGPNFDRSFTTRSVYLQNRFETGTLVLEAGARLDDTDEFGSTLSPKASLLWQAADRKARVRLGAGRGFRAPSINELVFPFYGNPALEPERSWTFEGALGGRLAGDRLDLELRLFRSDFEDLIATDPATFTAVNLDRARVEGAELSARAWPAAGLWLAGSATLQRARDRDRDEDLVRRPKRKAAVSVGYEQAGRFRVESSVVMVGAQRDVLVAGFPERNPAWTRVDLAGALTLPFAARRLELFARVENLLDEEYAELTGYPAPGINGQGGVRARF